MPGQSHFRRLERLKRGATMHLSPEDEAEVRFLIEQHLEMSATIQRRDVFDPLTARSFAAAVETRERLQRLCLLPMRYHAVNPEALLHGGPRCFCSLSCDVEPADTFPRFQPCMPCRRTPLEQLRALTGCEESGKIERFLEGSQAIFGRHSAAELRSFRYRTVKCRTVQMELTSAPHAYT